MPFFLVTHTHTSCLEAANEADAREQLAQAVRDNADSDDCEADEITEEEYALYWEHLTEDPSAEPCDPDDLPGDHPAFPNP